MLYSSFLYSCMFLIVPVFKIRFCTVEASKQTRSFLFLSFHYSPLSCVDVFFFFFFMLCFMADISTFCVVFENLIYVVIDFYDLIPCQTNKQKISFFLRRRHKTFFLDSLFFFSVLVSCYSIVYVCCCLVVFSFYVRYVRRVFDTE